MEFRGLRIAGRWTPQEFEQLRSTLAPIPAAWLEKNPNVQAIIRQDVLRNAPPQAPGHSQYDKRQRAIVVFDKGVYHAGSRGIDKEQFRRSILHELAHAILIQRPNWLREWADKTRHDGFVDEYARTSPAEDFADTFSEFFIHPKQTQTRAPEKYSFIGDRLAQEQGKRMNPAETYDKQASDAAVDNGFADELLKTGGPASMLSEIGRMPRGIKALGLAGAGLGAYEAGRVGGRKRGRQEGVTAVRDVAERAYKAGVIRGATAMRQHIISRMRRASGQQGQ